MVRTIATFILALGWTLLTRQAYGQAAGFVVAGQPSGGNSYAHDFIPDLVRVTHALEFSYHPSEFDSLPVDLDGNQVSDALFFIESWEDHGVYSATLHLNAKAGNEIALEPGTSQVLALQAGDTIDASLDWSGALPIPLLQRQFNYDPDNDTIQISNVPLQSTIYAGIRFQQLPMNTCYGWVEFTVEGTFPQIEVTVKAVATDCGQSPTVYCICPGFPSIDFYPNPATEHVSVGFHFVSGGDYVVRLIGPQGLEFFSETVTVREGSQYLEIDVAQLPPAAYNLMVEGGGQRISKRVIILR